MVEKIDNSNMPHLMRIVQKKYPYVKKILGDFENMVYTTYIDIFFVIDCEKFLEFYKINNKESLDFSFLNRTTYNFHFVLSSMFGLTNRDIEKKVKKDGEDMKTKIKELANALISSDDNFIKTLEGKELIINNVKFYFDCDNIY